MTNQMTHMVQRVRDYFGGFLTEAVAPNSTVERFLINSLPRMKDDIGKTFSGEIGGLIVPTPSGQPEEALLAYRAGLDLLTNKRGEWIVYALNTASGLPNSLATAANRVSKVQQFGISVEIASQARASIDAVTQIRMANEAIGKFEKERREEYKAMRRTYLMRRSFKGIVASARTVNEASIYQQLVIQSGGKLALDGVGNTYMTFNSNTGCVEIWVQGVKIQEIPSS